MALTLPDRVQTKITLAGKTIVITGTNCGIGLGIAESCLTNNANRVYSLDISEPGDGFKTLSQRFEGRLLPIQADITKEEAATAAIERIIAEAGGLHGMVMNAGRTHRKAGFYG